jgi:hypothetical protein
VNLQDVDVGQSLPRATVRSVKELTLCFRGLDPPIWPQMWRGLTQLTSLAVYCRDAVYCREDRSAREAIIVPANLEFAGEILASVRDLELTTTFIEFSNPIQHHAIAGAIRNFGSLRLLRVNVRFVEVLSDERASGLDEIGRRLCRWKSGTSFSQSVTSLHSRVLIFNLPG